ncbi:putative tbc-domain-containing protein [Diaporthe ampelina]|uniref:Putative tbc-domain-containing protein n=1 Tax=Diaporthe ampelina TaxID=1214573 RepID=A0A0G2FCB0_9PEZI|nr:putative tbc-domain-containing protein [Diaporthe ampelina]
MDAEASTSPLELERSISQASVHSTKSQRSATVRATSRRRGKLTSQPSSSATSIAESDKSLVSFPSFSPVSPRDEAPSTPSSPSPVPATDGADEATQSAAVPYIQPPPLREDAPARPPSAIVETLLTTTDKPLLLSTRPRTALFEDDAPVLSQNLPGALHVADDAHIKRLIERHGALGLVRSIAEDLAARDAQITALRRRSEDRERALRKIILECGLSNMDLETRLKAVEREARNSGARKGGVEELVEDAMSQDFVHSSGVSVENGATIRARNTSNAADPENKATSKGWKDYLWGSNKNTGSRASSVNGDTGKQTVLRAPAPDRRPTIQEDLFSPPEQSSTQERWDTMAADPSGELAARPESGSEYLTDRFGFIYDQRRKKRQREAQQMAKQFKRGSRTEMLSNGRANMSPLSTEDGGSTKWDAGSDDRPSTPSSAEEARDESKPKRWQDYLKIATFPTELLSHTPSISAPTIEVLEGGEIPRSPGLIPAEDDRGFIPPAIIATAAVSEEPVTVTEEPAAGTLVKEDAEPVRILLQQLSEVHDGLQREKTVRWNDFLRKVRAERRREGEAANASAAEAAAARFQKATAMMPEARVADGELIGVANWANKGKVGRAKWNEFNRLVLGGIPVLIRSKIWAECSGALNLRVPGYYDDLVNRAELDDNPEVAQQIRADINRTLTDNIFFRKGPGVQKLNEVLLAYSRRNPEVGYCQGMNLITANLLLIMPSAEEAFWILVCIIEKILPSGYYDHSLLASRADQQVLRGYVAEVLPRLSAHFDELGIALETMTFQWFLSVFTDCLSAEALFRVWDVVLCFGDGSTFLFQVALALLKLNEQQLLGCDSPAAVYTYINHQMTNHAISIDGLIQASEGLRRVVKREDVDGRREKAIEAEQELVRQREERLKVYKERKAAAAAASASTVVDKAEEPQPAAPEGQDAATGETVAAGSSAVDLTVQEPAPIEEEAG